MYCIKDDNKYKLNDDIDEIECEVYNFDFSKFNIFKIIKKYINNKKTNKCINKKYINYYDAIKIASDNDNLIKSLHDDITKNGYECNNIILYNYYATLVFYKDKLAWYIKVINGIYEIKDNDRIINKSIDEKSKINCLVLAESGNYIYINDSYKKDIRMINDDEFLDILFKFK